MLKDGSRITREEMWGWDRFCNENRAVIDALNTDQYTLVRRTWLTGYRLGFQDGVTAIKEGRLIV